MMIDGWLSAAEALDLMHWHLLRPAPGAEFIQNDQGIARLEASMRFFPLAPDACLLVCEGSRSLSIHGSTPQAASEYMFARRPVDMAGRSRSYRPGWGLAAKLLLHLPTELVRRVADGN
jgi:hypothetical protein